MNVNQRHKVDAVIIGGGPAGMMAGISVKIHHPELQVLIIDRSIELGRKLLVSGAGRANLTNVNLKSNPGKYYNQESFVNQIFSQFDYARIFKFFRDCGIPLYEEIKSGRGKIFPVIGSAKTVREILVDKLIESDVEIKLNHSVNEINFVAGDWEIKSIGESFYSKYLILSAGGRTYPALGSDGSGYNLAISIGHRIIDPVPSAVPLVSKNLLSHYLQGETVRMRVKSKINGVVSDETVGEVMFTQYGLSGPAIFDVSRKISLRLNREKINDVKIILSFLPDLTEAEIKQELTQRLANHPKLPVSHILYGLLTIKSSGSVCAVSNIPKERIADDITDTEKVKLFQILNSYEVEVTQTRSWNEAEFTAGGVDVNEIDGYSMSSKINPDLYFAGEIIDVDGMVGGYNLSWAWASGWVAGKLGQK